ncbi:Kelch repeat-containing protein [Pontibacter oryzae]|uniref:Galactose oxidase n=1 Tax=Pontibacter oryzae TaxID=2304593 RepID=A0A399RWX9_9BACT|nr:kelch repeat-containing protein [Pontibacter oryzae]RIJ34317.1 galactose oxidase [Pontibacter oryzae]
MKITQHTPKIAWRFILSLALVCSLGTLTSCDSSDEEDDLLGDWIKDSDFAGVSRTSAVAFTIDGMAYVGTGYDGSSRLRDFWQFDANKGSWIKKASFPGQARNAAVSFTANGKGYVGTGYDGTSYLKDFWEYDPSQDTWTQIADFPGSARYGAVALSLDEKGYVGAGYDGNYQKDFWQYNPATGQWTEKVGLGGAKRLNAFAFTFNGKGYIGGGINNGLYQTDFLEYDPANDSWVKLKGLNEDDRENEDYPAARTGAVTLVFNNKVYLVSGSNGSVLSDVWEYDPASDAWTAKSYFEGSSREGAVGFASGNYGYITTGQSGGYRFDDLWRFDPSAYSDN